MPSTSRDYAAKGYLDPVAEVEREALERGFRRGAISTAVIFIASFVVVEVFLAAGRFATERVIPWLQAVL